MSSESELVDVIICGGCGSVLFMIEENGQVSCGNPDCNALISTVTATISSDRPTIH